MKKKTFMFVLFIVMLLCNNINLAEDGYRLWLRYDKLPTTHTVDIYKLLINGIITDSDSPTITAAREELQIGLRGLLNSSVPLLKKINFDGIIVIGKYDASPLISSLNLKDRIKNIGPEGYLIFNSKLNNKKVIVITAQEDAGVLYGVFHFLRLIQTYQDIQALDIQSSPKIQVRVLDHWDNLNRTVERGYAGFSIWDWHKLPDYTYAQYKDYARANASIGINGTVLTNVNADSHVLTPGFLTKVASLANVFRPYGIKVYLTARFSAPREIGGLKTADPLDPQVQQWWKDKAKEIYALIPDFGGFLVKANSEGQPGPQNYGRNHADGANMLADAVKPYKGIVMWRAFVYDNNVPDDRAKQAYNEFHPLDGKFRDNVLIQVKNGPIDFQPREPFHPLFGGMPKTPLMMEFQITQEYLGQATQLVYLAPMYKECLESDTYVKGQGSTVAKIIDGSVDNHTLSGIAGVSNIGTDRNWTGHLFGQANWYCFGRLAWDHSLSPKEIADEWIKMTFSNDPAILKPLEELMLSSREHAVNYMTPLGLHHMMGTDHHYGPGPWINNLERADWNPVYYHRADNTGLGFDRTANGSNALSQYAKPVEKMYSSLESCPEEYLLWFHHISWDYKMKSGKTLWEELCSRYYDGVEGVRKMQTLWNSAKIQIDNERFEHVRQLLGIQEKEAIWWRNACLLYFQTFSKKPIPEGLEKPDQTLEYYQSLNFPYAPGILKCR